MASQKRMVDLDAIMEDLAKNEAWSMASISVVRRSGERVIASDASTSSPEHRTLTGLPVEFAALKERVENLEKLDIDHRNNVLKLYSVGADTATRDVRAVEVRLAKLEASVKALASPVKLYVTPVGTDQFGAPKADAFFQAPDPPKPVPPPAPEGYEHLDPPEFRIPADDNYCIDEFALTGKPGAFKVKDSRYLAILGEKGRRWIVRPKPVAAAAPKQEDDFWADHNRRVIAAIKSCRERGVSYLCDPTCKALYEEAARHMMKGFRPGGAA